MEKVLTLNIDGQLIIKDYTEGCFVVFNGENIPIKNDDGTYYCDITEDGLYNFHREENGEVIDQLFSIYNLRKCLLNRERDYLNSFLSNCKGSIGKCSQNDSSAMADFLLASIFVLEQLICAGNFDEATRILDLINNNGCGICSEVKTNTNDCGCGKSI